jgi:CPA2 family monovalent cation:H+ antiporter-2
LLGFFFITVGMSLNWRLLIAHWSEILSFLLLLVTIKATLVAVVARLFGWSMPGSVQLGFMLAQGSEFVFVIVAMPMVRLALGEELVGIVITSVAASLACTPAIVSYGNRLARIIKRRMTAAVPVSEITPVATVKPIVVFGMDEIGRSVADALEAHGVPYDAVEGDYDRFLAASADGYPVAFGNPGDERLMETLGYAERCAVVVTNEHYEMAEALNPIMQERYPKLTRFIAVHPDAELSRYEEVGLKPVALRTVPRGLDLAAAVLRYQHIDENRIQMWMLRQQGRALQNSIEMDPMLLPDSSDRER